MSLEMVNRLSPQEQAKLLPQLYALLDEQVKSYHRQRNMGANSSVPTELARELIASVEYTIGLVGGPDGRRDLVEQLRLGQQILGQRLENAGKLLRLVSATGPDWQTECRWDAICALKQYLASYDLLHLAHQGPDVFYPPAIPVPAQLQGVDAALFYLNVLWAENQDMADFSQEELAALWARLPADTLNQWEQVLLNSLGKQILGADGLVFTEGERAALGALPTPEFTHRWLSAARERRAYGCQAAQSLLPRVLNAHRAENLGAIFL